MKSILAIFIVIAGHYVTLAQNKNNLYIDLGLNEPGVSATYDKKLMKHFDIGVGVSAYNFNDVSYGNFRSACYVDLRPFWVIKRNLLFVLADIGLAIYGGREPEAARMSGSGLYTGLGFGYCYQINKRGMGPYVSLGLAGYTQSIHYLDPPPPPKRADYSSFDATGILSVGFKF